MSALLTGALLVALSTSAHALADPVPEGTARNFAILAGSTITNTNSSTVIGDMGLSPLTSITGYSQITHTGEVHVANPVADGAKDALTGAYNNAAAQGTEFTIGADLAGANLAPGVYAPETGGAFGLSGTLTLSGDASSIFIFQMTSTLITSSSSSIVLNGDISPCNIYWQVGSSATLGSSSSFVGTIMADQSITVNSGAQVQGRLWARVAAVTLDDNTITNPCFTPGATGEGTGVPEDDDGTTGGDDDTSEGGITTSQVPTVPSGPVATGDGSMSGGPSPLLLWVGATLAALVAASFVVVRRRTG